MGVDCYGWVEVCDPTSPRDRVGFPISWGGVIRIDNIIERNYRVFGYFFGARNPFDEALASHRGLPAHVSQSVLGEVDEPNEVGATWLLWNDIADGDWRTKIELPPGWALLFSLMGQLAAHYGSERVCLVVWFDHAVGV